MRPGSRDAAGLKSAGGNSVSRSDADASIPPFSSSASSSSSAAAASSRLVDDVVQVKRRRLHLKLTSTEVGSELRRDGAWLNVSDKQLRTAIEKANQQLGIDGSAAADVVTWRCKIDACTDAQISKVLELGADESRTNKAAVDTMAGVGALLDAVFTFSTNWTARRLCQKVRSAHCVALNLGWGLRPPPSPPSDQRAHHTHTPHAGA